MDCDWVVPGACPEEIVRNLNILHRHGPPSTQEEECAASLAIATIASVMATKAEETLSILHSLVLRSIADDLSQRIIYCATGRLWQGAYYGAFNWRSSVATRLKYTDLCYESLMILALPERPPVVDVGKLEFVDGLLQTTNLPEEARRAARLDLQTQVQAVIDHFLGADPRDPPGVRLERRKDFEKYLQEMRSKGTTIAHPIVGTWSIIPDLHQRLLTMEAVAPPETDHIDFSKVAGAFCTAVDEVPLKWFRPNGVRRFDAAWNDEFLVEIELQKYGL